MRRNSEKVSQKINYLFILLAMIIMIGITFIFYTYTEIREIENNKEKLEKENNELKQNITQIYITKEKYLKNFEQLKNDLIKLQNETEETENKFLREINLLSTSLLKITSLSLKEEERSTEYSDLIFNINEELLKANEEFSKCKEEIFQNEEEWQIFLQRKIKLKERLQNNKRLAKPYLFIHIAKTGGTSLISAIKGVWKNSVAHFWSAPLNEIEVLWKSMLKPSFIGGHICHGFHKFIDLINANADFFDLPPSLRPPIPIPPSPSSSPLPIFPNFYYSSDHLNVDLDNNNNDNENDISSDNISNNISDNISDNISSDNNDNMNGDITNNISDNVIGIVDKKSDNNNDNNIDNNIGEGKRRSGEEDKNNLSNDIEEKEKTEKVIQMSNHSLLLDDNVVHINNIVNNNIIDNNNDNEDNTHNNKKSDNNNDNNNNNDDIIDNKNEEYDEENEKKERKKRSPSDGMNNNNKNDIVNTTAEYKIVKVKESKLKEGEEYTYFTVVREPISRVLSHYNYHYFRLDDPNHWRAENKTLSEWLMETKYSHNAMTVYIGGFEHYAWWNEDEDFSLLPKNNDPPNHYFVTEEHYQIARKHLFNFGLIGLQEMFDESLEHMNKMMGMNKEVLKLNSGDSHQKIVPTEEELILIKSLNNYDIKIYKLSVALFNQQQQILDELADEINF